MPRGVLGPRSFCFFLRSGALGSEGLPPVSGKQSSWRNRILRKNSIRSFTVHTRVPNIHQCAREQEDRGNEEPWQAFRRHGFRRPGALPQSTHADTEGGRSFTSGVSGKRRRRGRGALAGKRSGESNWMGVPTGRGIIQELVVHGIRNRETDLRTGGAGRFEGMSDWPGGARCSESAGRSQVAAAEDTAHGHRVNEVGVGWAMFVGANFCSHFCGHFCENEWLPPVGRLMYRSDAKIVFSERSMIGSAAKPAFLTAAHSLFF